MQRWLGFYNCSTDTFNIIPWRKLPAGTYCVEFTPEEELLIDAAAGDRSEFTWDADWNELTENSQAYWSMM